MSDSNSVARIGRCHGCDRTCRIADGVCGTCLAERGRSWAEMAHRVRTDPAFALAVYCEITSDRRRELFVSLFGRPWLPETEKAVGVLRDLMGRAGWRPVAESALAAYDLE